MKGLLTHTSKNWRRRSAPEFAVIALCLIPLLYPAGIWEIWSKTEDSWIRFHDFYERKLPSERRHFLPDAAAEPMEYMNREVRRRPDWLRAAVESLLIFAGITVTRAIFRLALKSRSEDAGPANLKPQANTSPISNSDPPSSTDQAE